VYDLSSNFYKYASFADRVFHLLCIKKSPDFSATHFPVLLPNSYDNVIRYLRSMTFSRPTRDSFQREILIKEPVNNSSKIVQASSVLSNCSISDQGINFRSALRYWALYRSMAANYMQARNHEEADISLLNDIIL